MPLDLYDSCGEPIPPRDSIWRVTHGRICNLCKAVWSLQEQRVYNYSKRNKAERRSKEVKDLNNYWGDKSNDY